MLPTPERAFTKQLKQKRTIIGRQPSPPPTTWNYVLNGGCVTIWLEDTETKTDDENHGRRIEYECYKTGKLYELSLGVNDINSIDPLFVYDSSLLRNVLSITPTISTSATGDDIHVVFPITIVNTPREITIAIPLKVYPDDVNIEVVNLQRQMRVLMNKFRDLACQTMNAVNTIGQPPILVFDEYKSQLPQVRWEMKADGLNVLSKAPLP